MANIKKKFKIIARHNNWVAGSKITESFSLIDVRIRRFTATIEGWRNWKIYEGPVNDEIINSVITKVKNIRDRIKSGDKTVFEE